MPKWTSQLLVWALMLCGILLGILGIGGLRELLVVGKIPPEMLGRRAGYTVGSLAFSMAMIIWCLVAGIAWARSGAKGRSGRTAN